MTGKFNPSKATFPPVLSSAITPSLKGDFFVAKYDATGRNLWYHASGGPGNDQGNAITLDDTGNVLAAGTFDSAIRFGTTTLTNVPGLGIFLTKFDPDGKVLWAVKPSGPHGGEPHGVRTDAAGAVYLSGYFYGTAIFGGTTLRTGGNPDFFLAKYDAAGNALWALQNGDGAIVVPLGFTLNPQGHVFATGYFRSDAMMGGSFLPNAGGRDAFVVRIDVPPPTPRLSITRQLESIAIQWPKWAADYQLEAASGPVFPARWSAVSNNVSSNDDQFSTTDDILAPARFYRLRKP